jgi:hypothetical protein
LPGCLKGEPGFFIGWNRGSEQLFNEAEKAKPVVRQGRKATGLLKKIAGLPQKDEVKIMKKQRFSVIAILVIALVLLVYSPSIYALSLIISDGPNTVQFSDGAPLDGSLLDGVILYNGPVGTNWIVNVTTGISKPVIGPGSIDLNSVNVSSNGGGTLDIWLSDWGFPYSSSLTPLLSGGIGGTTDGTVTAEMYNDFVYDGTTNNEFALLGGQINLGPFSSGAFSGEATLSEPGLPTSLPAWFSLTIHIKIVHGSGGQITSFDAHLDKNPVPEPGTVLLLGFGLLGIVALGRKRLMK